GLQDQVGDCSPTLSGGLVEDDPRVRQRRTLTVRAGSEKYRADTNGLADDRGRDLRADVSNGVVDRQHGAGVAALTVDVQLNITLGVVRLQVEQLSDEGVRDTGIDGSSEVDDSLCQQVGVDIRDPVTARMLREDA